MMVGPFQKKFSPITQLCALAAGDGDQSSLSSSSNNFLEIFFIIQNPDI